MIVVLIHWRIKPTDEAVGAFFNWWKNTATIKDKSNLVGEFLSAPEPSSKFKFLVNDLSPQPGEAPHRAFVNVGFWKDWESFYEQVGHNFDDDRPPQPFEAARRTRTILEAKEWRVGGWQLPKDSTCP
jgi:hypothetical protein